MYRDVKTVKLFNSETYKREGKLIAAMDNILYQVYMDCVKSGEGVWQDGAYGIMTVKPTMARPKYGEDYSIMGIQDLFKSKGVITTTKMNGVTVPHVVSDCGNIRDGGLIAFMKELQETYGINVFSIKGLKFSGGNVYMFMGEDMPKINKKGNPKDYFQHSKVLPGVYVVLGEYSRNEPGDSGIDLFNLDGQMSIVKPLSEVNDPNFSVDFLVAKIVEEKQAAMGEMQLVN